MAAQRDSKGRFVKGNTEGQKSPISNGLATEMQARSVEARKRNRTLADVVREELGKVAPGMGITKMEYLAAKAIGNHASGEMTFKDLRDLQKVLGEDVLNIETNGPQVIVVSQQAVEAAKKWSK